MRLHTCGIDPLINETVNLPSANISVCGLQMDRCFYKRFRKYPMKEEYLRSIRNPQQDKFQILIATIQEYFEEYAKWERIWWYPGHVHGGLMHCLIWVECITEIDTFSKYDGGRFKEGNSEMILSRGLGTHTLPIRILIRES